MALSPNSRLVHQAIIEKALKCFGQENVVALFEHLEEKGIKKEQILDVPERFAEALEYVFGKGAKILEHQIIFEICMIGNVQFNSSMTLAGAIRKLRD